MNERYALFAGDNYYPDGGWGDYRGSGTIEELKELFAKGWNTGVNGHISRFDWGEIVNLETLEIVTAWRNWSKEEGWS